MNQPAPVTNSIVSPLPIEQSRERQRPDTVLSNVESFEAQDKCRLSNAKSECRNAKTSKPRRTATSAAFRHGKQIVDSSLPETNDGWEEKVKEHRERQESVADILQQTFGPFAEWSPDLWERRAFLLLVGLLYQWLATNEKEVSTDELVALSKVLAEQRRAEAQSRNELEKVPGPQADRGGSELPEDFGKAVKQVYGTVSQE